jgi:hypothetical protein
MKSLSIPESSRAELQSPAPAGQRPEQMKNVVRPRLPLSPWRARASFVRCVCPVVAGLLECMRVLASLFKEWPLGLKRCEDASHSQSTSRTKADRQCEMPWTHSAPTGVISVIRGCLFPLSRDWRPPPRIPYKSRVMRGCLLSPKENFHLKSS